VKRAALVMLAALSSGCGLFVTRQDFDVVKAQAAALDKQGRDQQADIATLKTDLQSTRDRLENALRANADTGSDILSSKARMNDLAGRIDELSHAVDEAKTNAQAARTEIDTKLDAITRNQAAAPTPALPPVKIPADKATHFQAVEGAVAQKDWPLVRTLGHEYVTRYPADDKADDVQFLLGDADLQDNRPTSSLGELNKLLKVYPHSDKLDRTLFDMGEAYLELHDCGNAKLAFVSVEQRFSRLKIGADARARLAAIEHPAPGMCAPQP
jgi:TolA-binding protein